MSGALPSIDQFDPDTLMGGGSLVFVLGASIFQICSFRCWCC